MSGSFGSPEKRNLGPESRFRPVGNLLNPEIYPANIAKMAIEITNSGLMTSYRRAREKLLEDAYRTYRYLFLKVPQNNVEYGERFSLLDDVLGFIAEIYADDATEYPVLVARYITKEYASEDKSFIVQRNTFELTRVDPSDLTPQVRGLGIKVGSFLEYGGEALDFASGTRRPHDGFSIEDYLEAEGFWKKQTSLGINLFFSNIDS